MHVPEQPQTEPVYSNTTGEEQPAAVPEPVATETPAEAAARATEWTSRPLPVAPAATPGASVLGVDPSSADWALSLQPRDASDAYRMAKAFHASGLYSKKFNSADAIWTVMLLGREYGLSALASLQSLTIIEGKVEMDAALIVAKVLRSGAADYFRIIESTDDHATWETRRRGDPAVKMSFSVAEAQRRCLFVVQRDGIRTTSNGKPTNWQKMPDVMCMWRAATKLARAIYPDVTRGLYGQGEIREATIGEAWPELDAKLDRLMAERDAPGNAQPAPARRSAA